MKASAEISMYPLTKDYEGLILDFIARLQARDDLRVEPNSLSTQIFGDYDAIMDALHQEIKLSFQQGVADLLRQSLRSCPPSDFRLKSGSQRAFPRTSKVQNSRYI